MPEGYWNRLARQPVRRRTFLRAAGATGTALAAAALVGCGGEDDEGTTASPAAPATTQPGAGATRAASPATESAVPRGGRLVLGSESDVETLDTAYITSGFATRTMSGSLENLMTSDRTVPAAEPSLYVGALAESYEQPDETTYVFHLRQGVKFHDGTDFDAEAVTWNYGRNTDESHPFYHERFRTTTFQQLRWVDSVEATDAFTSTWKVSAPFADFIRYVAIGPYHNFISPTAMEKAGILEYGNNPVGTGPYRFVDWQRGERIKFARFEDYWGEPAFLDELIVRPMPETTSRFVALQSGQIDVMYSGTPDLVAEAEADERLDVVATAAPTLNFFWGANTRDEPTNDVRIRQAMAWAIDWNTVVDDLLTGIGLRAYGPLPRGNFAYDPDFRAYAQQDLKKSRDLLAASGYADGIKLGKVLHSSAVQWGIPTVQVAQAMQAQLKEAGIEVTLEGLDWSTFIANGAKGLTPDRAAYMSTWGSETGYWFETMFHSSFRPPDGPNRWWYSNPQLDALLEKARGWTDEEERIEMYRQGQQIVSDDAVWLIGADIKRPDLVNSQTVGFADPYRGESVDLYRIYRKA